MRRKPSSAWTRQATCLLLLIALTRLEAETFKAALVARTNIVFNGKVVVDSFDSRDPQFSTSGQYDPVKRKAGGDIVVTENRSGVQINGSADWLKIYGRAYVGDNGPALFLGGTNGALGSKNWVDGGNVGIEAGWLQEYPGGYLPDAPEPASGGVTPAPGLFGGYAYKYILGSAGPYVLSALMLTNSGYMLVQGHQKLHIRTDLKLSGNGMIIILTNSSLTVYVGGSVDFSGNGVLNNSGLAANFTVYGLETCTNIQLTGGFIGTIYAPSSSCSISNAGGELFGTVVANSIAINGAYKLHYDEALLPLNIYTTAAASLGSPSVGDDKLLRFEVSGVPQADYTVESSTNLIDWSSVYTNSSPFTFTNNETGTEQRFFRAVYLP